MCSKEGWTWEELGRGVNMKKIHCMKHSILKTLPFFLKKMKRGKIIGIYSKLQTSKLGEIINLK